MKKKFAKVAIPTIIATMLMSSFMATNVLADTATTFPAQLTLTAQSTLYNDTGLTQKAGGTLSPQTVTAIAGEAGLGYFEVNTWLGPKYVATTNAVLIPPPTAVPATNVNYPTQLTLLNSAPLYKDSALTQPAGASISPQTVNAVSGGSNFYQVHTWLGNLYVSNAGALPGSLEPMNEVDRTLETLYLYNIPTVESTKLTSTISPQNITVLGQYKDWLKINTWLGVKWVHPTNILNGTVTQKTVQIKLNDATQGYNLPVPNATNIGTLQAGIYTSDQQYGDWYHFSSSSIGPVWVRNPNPILNFGVVSNAQDQTKTPAMLSDMANNLKPDALIVNGNGNSGDYSTLTGLVSAQTSLPTVYYADGNITNSTSINQFLSTTNQNSVYNDAYISGYHFLFLGTEADPTSSGQAYLSDAQFTWLQNKLAENYVPNKPIFVFLADNALSSAQETQLNTILAQYPEVIFFTSNTQTDLSLPNMVVTNGFTTVNDSSVSQPVDVNGNAESNSQGLFVQVYNDKVVINGREFTTDTFISGARNVINNIAPTTTTSLAPYSFTSNTLIAHGTGAINGIIVPESLEAIEQNYAKGFRVFEIDLQLTTDNYMVGRHDWMQYMYNYYQENVPSAKQVDGPMSLTQYQKITMETAQYHHVDAVELARLMQKYPDMYIVLDSKGTNMPQVQAEYSEIVSVFQKYNPSALNRLIPQIYNEDMLGLINKYYNFQNVIYTLYQTTDTDDQAIAFAAANNIKVIVVSDTRYTPALVQKAKAQGISVYVHTINDKTAVQKYLNDGANGVMTDTLQPSDLTQ